MPYCPACGNEVAAEAQFCSNCGNELETEISEESQSKDPTSSQQTTDSRRTLSFSVSEEDYTSSTQHVNVDNISFLTDLDKRPTDMGIYGLILVFIATVIVAMTVLGTGLFVSVVLGVVVAAAILLTLTDEKVELGTVSDTYIISDRSIRDTGEDMESDEVQDIEDRFLDVVPETISIEDTDDFLVYRNTFFVHFVPDNVVSIKQSVSYTLIGRAFLAAAMLSGIGAVIFLINIDLVKMLGILIAGVVSFILFVIFGVQNGIEISTHGGEEQFFEMNEQSCREVINQFRTRDEGKVSVEGEADSIFHQ